MMCVPAPEEPRRQRRSGERNRDVARVRADGRPRPGAVCADATLLQPRFTARPSAGQRASAVWPGQAGPRTLDVWRQARGRDRDRLLRRAPSSRRRFVVPRARVCASLASRAPRPPGGRHLTLLFLRRETSAQFSGGFLRPRLSEPHGQMATPPSATRRLRSAPNAPPPLPPPCASPASGLLPTAHTQARPQADMLSLDLRWQGWSDVHIAAANGDVSKLRQLILKGAAPALPLSASLRWRRPAPTAAARPVAPAPAARIAQQQQQQQQQPSRPVAPQARMWTNRYPKPSRRRCT